MALLFLEDSINNCFLLHHVRGHYLSARAIPRVRLLQRLQQGALGRLTLVSAPAGYGKTTAVCQWIRDGNLTVAW
jgi:ATP/maltotriose-dependent transcriptional regulator MalT